MTNPQKRINRQELKPGEVLCSYCTARCCRYFALPIEKPKQWNDFEHLRWYVMHGRTAIFVDDGVWYLLVYGDCENLQTDNLCGIYETRPGICAVYSTDSCEYDNDGCYDMYFETAAQIEEYAETLFPATRKQRQALRRDRARLPLLSGGE